MARYLGTEHTEAYLRVKDAKDVVPALPYMYDEPFGDSSQIRTHLVSVLARKKVTVALSGDGGDELFGGYNRYLATARLLSFLNRAPEPLIPIPLRDDSWDCSAEGESDSRWRTQEVRHAGSPQERLRCCLSSQACPKERGRSAGPASVALAAISERGTRTEDARIGGVTLQIVRD